MNALLDNAKPFFKKSVRPPIWVPRPIILTRDCGEEVVAAVRRINERLPESDKWFHLSAMTVEDRASVIMEELESHMYRKPWHAYNVDQFSEWLIDEYFCDRIVARHEEAIRRVIEKSRLDYSLTDVHIFGPDSETCRRLIFKRCARDILVSVLRNCEAREEEPTTQEYPRAKVETHKGMPTWVWKPKILSPVLKRRTIMAIKELNDSFVGGVAESHEQWWRGVRWNRDTLCTWQRAFLITDCLVSGLTERIMIAADEGILADQLGLIFDDKIVASRRPCMKRRIREVRADEADLEEVTFVFWDSVSLILRDVLEDIEDCETEAHYSCLRRWWNRGRMSAWKWQREL